MGTPDLAFQPCFSVHHDVFFFHSLPPPTQRMMMMMISLIELLGRLRPQPVLLLHGVVGLGLLADVEHVAHAHVAVLVGVLADLALVAHVPADVAVRLGALRPDAALWRHLAAEFGTLGSDDGPVDAVLKLAVPEDVVLGDLVGLELVPDPPVDVAVGLDALRLVVATRGAL